MTSIMGDVDFETIILEDDEPQLTCEFRYQTKKTCGRPAYVSAQLQKPCGHYNAGFLICKQHWEWLLAVSGFIRLNCGRCGTPFDIKACIVSWDLV